MPYITPINLVDFLKLTETRCIWVESEQESEDVQTILLANGYTWADLTCNIAHTNKPILCVSDKSITYFSKIDYVTDVYPDCQIYKFSLNMTFLPCLNPSQVKEFLAKLTSLTQEFNIKLPAHDTMHLAPVEAWEKSKTYILEADEVVFK